MENGKTLAGKFAEGNAFGKGRPPSKIICLREQFGEQGQQDFNQRMYELAMNGESAAIKYIGERMCPAPKPQRYIEHVSLQSIKTEDQLDEAMEKILAQVGAGELSLEDALDTSVLVEKRGIMLMKREIESLEREEAMFDRMGQ